MRWERLSFTLPSGWMLDRTEMPPDRPGRKDTLIRKGERSYMWAIMLAEDPGSDYREAFDRGVAGELPTDWAVPGTVRVLEIGGRKALLSLGRHPYQHGEKENWDLLIDGGTTIFSITSPGYERGYVMKDDSCAYWTVVRSLKID